MSVLTVYDWESGAVSFGFWASNGDGEDEGEEGLEASRT